MHKADHAYALARRLRRDLTLPEALLWRELRRRAAGFRFRRQHPVGPFVIDFYCASAKLGVEVDGAAHGMGDRPERDLERAEFLAAQGIALIRVAAVEVLRNPQGVAEAVAAACCERGGGARPPPPGGGGPPP